MKAYWIEPWEDSIPYGNGIILLNVVDNTYEILSVPEPTNKIILCGKYMTYPEGVFGLFMDEEDHLYVFTQGLIVPLADVTSMHHDVGLGYRELILYVRNGEFLRYRYLSIWRLLMRPGIILDMIFVDMWELNFELPSWVARNYQQGDEGMAFMKKVCRK
jgi:hypothetical protein